jgi:sugar phosphate isomerase/epimerase
MRFGCCLNLLSTKPDGIGIEFVEAVARAGFDYAELPLAEMMRLSDKDFDALLERVKKSGVRCEACNNFFPKTLRLTGDEAEADAAFAYAREALGRAAALGASAVVFGSAGARMAPEGFPKGRALQQLLRLIRAFAPVAEAHGITIVVEPLRRQECNIVNTFREACRLAREVGLGNVKALVDFYHFSEEYEPVEHIEKTGAQYLRHVHFARPGARVFPADIEEFIYEPFIDALKAVGYDGRVSLEAYTKDFEKDAAVALKFFRDNF